MENVKKVVNEALKWVGYLEKKSNAQLEDFTANAGSANFTIFGKLYDDWWKYAGFKLNGDAWCAGFVSVVFRSSLGQAAQEAVMPNFHYCPTGVNQFKALGCWVPSSGKPVAGDVIFFKNSSGVSNHVGIVERVEGGRVYTVEGNTNPGNTVVPNGGGVARKSYPVDFGSILGYGRPDYKKIEEEIDMEQLKALEKRVSELEARNAELEKTVDVLRVKYNFVPDFGSNVEGEMPKWAREPVSFMFDNGILKGDENGNLQLSDMKLWVCTVVGRLAEWLAGLKG